MDFNKGGISSSAGFPGCSVVKESQKRQAGDVGLIPELRRSPGVGNINPL